MHFIKAHPSIPDPKRPLDDVRGEISARALKHCEPLLAANRTGWLLSPPVDFALFWNGTEILLNYEGMDETILLDRVFLPGFHQYWAESAPNEALGHEPISGDSQIGRMLIQPADLGG